MLQLVSFFHPLKCSYLYSNWCINKSINWFIFLNQGLKKKCFNKRQMLDSSQWVKQAGRYDKKFWFFFLHTFSTSPGPLFLPQHTQAVSHLCWLSSSNRSGEESGSRWRRGSHMAEREKRWQRFPIKIWGEENMKWLFLKELKYI